MNYKFTKLLFLSTLVGASLHAREFTCVGKVFRENGGTLGKKAESRFMITLEDQANGRVKAKSIYGHVTIVGYDDHHVAEAASSNTYGVFSYKNLKNDPDYDPTKYTNHVQFEDINATDSSFINGGIWGNLVVNKTRPETDDGKFDAHYIFKAGDTIGGTIDYDCTI